MNRALLWVIALRPPDPDHFAHVTAHALSGSYGMAARVPTPQVVAMAAANLTRITVLHVTLPSP